MDEIGPRVMRLQRAAWRVRAASRVRCELPFALALMTDARAHEGLVSLMERLPGPPVLIVFRHYGLPPPERARLARDAYAAARAHGYPFVVAGGGLPADGAHNARGPGLRTASVHSLGEAAAKRALRPHLRLVSPVFPTRSHPGAPALGPARAAAIAAWAGPSFALGGVDGGSASRLVGTPFVGVAAMGAFAP